MSGNVFEENCKNEERKGATKIEQQKQNENAISKGVDEGRNSKDGILKGKTEEKEG